MNANVKPRYTSEARLEVIRETFESKTVTKEFFSRYLDEFEKLGEEFNRTDFIKKYISDAAETASDAETRAILEQSIEDEAIIGFISSVIDEEYADYAARTTPPAESNAFSDRMSKVIENLKKRFNKIISDLKSRVAETYNKVLGWFRKCSTLKKFKDFLKWVDDQYQMHPVIGDVIVTSLEIVVTVLLTYFGDKLLIAVLGGLVAKGLSVGAMKTLYWITNGVHVLGLSVITHETVDRYRESVYGRIAHGGKEGYDKYLKHEKESLTMRVNLLRDDVEPAKTKKLDKLQKRIDKIGPMTFDTEIQNLDQKITELENATYGVKEILEGT